jgi:hypothetical protein
MPARRVSRAVRAVQLRLDGAPLKPQPAAPRVLRQSERDFMAAVIELATVLHWKHWHDYATNAPRSCWHCGRKSIVPRNAAGFPDLLLVRRPRVLFVELKRDGEQPTADQQLWLDELTACGQEVYVWTPSDWTAIERALRDERVT